MSLRSATIFLVIAAPWGYYEIPVFGSDLLGWWTGVLALCVIGLMEAFVGRELLDKRAIVAVTLITSTILVLGISPDELSVAADFLVVAAVVSMYVLGSFKSIYDLLSRIKVLAFLVAIDVACWCVTYFTGVGGTGILAAQVSRGETVEYQDIYSAVLVLACLDHMWRHQRHRFLLLSLLGLVTITSGSRLYEAVWLVNLAMMLLSAPFFRRNAAFVNSITIILAVTTVASVGLVCSVTGSEIAVFGDVCVDLYGRWYAPVVSGSGIPESMEWLIGGGPAAHFYIPWFEYRELEVMSPSLDSAFVYAVVKFGVVVSTAIFSLIFYCSMGDRVSRWWLPFLLATHNVLLSPNYIPLLLISKQLVGFRMQKIQNA